MFVPKKIYTLYTNISLYIQYVWRTVAESLVSAIFATNQYFVALHTIIGNLGALSGNGRNQIWPKGNHSLLLPFGFWLGSSEEQTFHHFKCFHCVQMH
jgi:hypothetical protein